MATNNFKPFATGSGANVTTQADYEALPALQTGFQSGKASSAQINKAIRQSSFIASSLAQFVSEKINQDVLDNGDVNSFTTKLAQALSSLSLSRANPFADIKTDGNISTALENLGLGDGSALPVGVPIPWPTNTPPAGWITMSGQSISQSQLPKLYAAYGAKLPDLRGMFIRGWDNGRGLDPSRALLNEQLPTGIRQFTGNNDVQFQGLGITQLVNPDGNDGYDSGWAVARNANQTTNSSGCNVSFVRPRNVSFNYIVRAA